MTVVKVAATLTKERVNRPSADVVAIDSSHLASAVAAGWFILMHPYQLHSYKRNPSAFGFCLFIEQERMSVATNTIKTMATSGLLGCAPMDIGADTPAYIPELS